MFDDDIKSFYVTIETSLCKRGGGSDDISTIKTRLKEYFLTLDTIDDGAKVETCYVSKADEYLAMIQEDGSFTDVDYKAYQGAANGAAWEPYLALDRLQAIAIAYHKQGNPLYQKEEVVNKMTAALNYWNSIRLTKEDHKDVSDGYVGPWNTNWWEREVGIQLRFCRIALFMEGVLDENTQKIMLDKMLEKKPVKYGTGQNNLWFDQNYIYHALLTNDSDKLHDMIDNYLSYCLITQKDDKTAEAVQVDNSFYMHGKQFYSNGYGMSMFRDMSFWIYMLRGTDFALGQDVIDRMANYMLEGTRWTIRGDLIELYLGYRPYKYDVGYKNYAYEYIEPLKRMKASDPDRASDYQKIIDNIEGDSQSNGKNGNYYMWRSAYASHMRDKYGVNIKMDSKEIIGGEWRGSWSNIGDGKDQGQLIYWTASASSAISVDGTEYISVYPVYDWRHVPGTTTPNRLVKDYANWGRVTNGSSHTIGVSNGKYGATAYMMDKKGTKGAKGYFFFDDEFVALGSGIQSSEDIAIHTTLNQSKAEGIKVDGNAVAKGTVDATKTIYNDSIGYVLLNDTKAKVSYDDQKDLPSLWPADQKEKADSVFTAYVDHGVKPTNGSYAYIVVPNKTEAEVNTYAQQVPVTVVANTADIQAVRHDGLKQTQINFYKAGTLEYKDGYTVTVDKPCSLIIDESGDERKITVAVSEENPQTGVAVVIENNNQKSTTGFMSKKAPYAGQPLTVVEGTENRFDASSTAEGYSVSNVRDGDENTSWQSQGNGNEYISVLTDTSKYIKDMSIVWGDNFAVQYDVYGSNDGDSYELITSITNKTKSTDNVPINGIYKYIKIDMKDSSGDCFQIKEIRFNESQLLSQKQPVEVSSTSAKDTGNTKEKAVDGDTTTRWSSSRDSHNEWISVDLGRVSKLDAVEIKWEGACSNNYSIEVSNDNKTWTTVKDKLKTDSSLLDQVVLGDSLEARYVRVHSFESNQAKYGISIYEFKVYGQYVSSNISLNKEVEVSSTHQESEVTQKVNAVDGKTDSKWSSQRKNPGFNTQEEWIVVDLGGEAYIDGLKIDWETGCSDNYRIEISSDNKTWTTVKDNLKSNTVNATVDHYIDEINFDKTLEARYVKIHSFSSRTKWGLNIWELEVLGAMNEKPSEPEEPDIDYGDNIALNKPAKASYEFKDTVDGDKVYYASLAFDGRTDKIDGKQSRWVSDRRKLPDKTINPNYSDDHYIQVDLQNTYNLSKVVLNWEGSGASEYKLQVSLDGETWTDISHITDGKGGIKEFILEDEIIARYVRMQGIKAASDYGYSLWEFEVYGETYEIPEVNIALNKPSKASSEFKDPADGDKVYYSSLAFDGSADKIDGKQSRWVSLRRKENPNVDVDSQYIQVDLENTYDLSRVVLNWEGSGAKQYKLQVSLDGETWTDISHVTDGKGGIREFKFDTETVARYVRMQGIEPGSQYGYSLWEFEVYGEVAGVIKDELKKELDAVDNLNKELYTPDSLKALETVYNSAKEVYENSQATQEDVDKAIKTLKEAFDKLVLKAEKTDLINEMKAVENIDKDLYTKDSLNKLEKAYNDAKDVNDDENATQKEVNTAVEALKEARKELVLKADKTNLKELLVKADAIHSDNYTTDSVKEFESIYTTAKKINANENATQEEVDKIVTDLQEAMKALVVKVNKEEAKEYIESIEQIDYTKYTDETGKVYSDAYLVLDKMLKDLDNVSADDFQKAKADFEFAIKGLKEKIVINVDPDKPEVDVDPDKPISHPKDDDEIKKPDSSTETSDNTNIVLPLSMLMFAGIGMLIIKKRKSS